jgi:hypothetical protein
MFLHQLALSHDPLISACQVAGFKGMDQHAQLVL